MIYLLAGGYLVYLAWQMLQSRGDMAGTTLIIATIAPIAFAVFGVALVVSSIRTLMKPEEEEPTPDVPEGEEEVQTVESGHEESALVEEQRNKEE